MDCFSSHSLFIHFWYVFLPKCIIWHLSGNTCLALELSLSVLKQNARSCSALMKRYNMASEFHFWIKLHYLDGLVQERCNSIANTLELRLSCSDPFICVLNGNMKHMIKNTFQGLISQFIGSSPTPCIVAFVPTPVPTLGSLTGAGSVHLRAVTEPEDRTLAQNLYWIIIVIIQNLKTMKEKMKMNRKITDKNTSGLFTKWKEYLMLK